MFQEKHDNDAISLLMLWGRTHFFHPADESLPDIEKAFQSLIDSAEEQNSILDQGVSRLEARVEEALAELESDLTLNLDPDEAMDAGYGLIFSEDQDFQPENTYQRIVCALQSLDDVVYLNHALHHFPKPEAWDKSWGKNKEKILDLLDRIVTDDLPWTMRLIPLNALRRDFIENVPEEKRYLFPWYEEFCTLPENALMELSLAIAGEILPEAEGISQEDLNLMWVEIQNDHELLEQVLETAAIIRSIPRAMKMAYAIRWIEAANKAAAVLRMPETVSEAGAVTVAIHVIAKMIIEKKLDAARFYAGFCGLGLERAQRIKLLKPFETRLKNNELDLSQPPFDLLQKWESGQLSDHELANTMLDDWREKLVVEAEKITGWVDESLYWHLLTEPDAERLAHKIFYDSFLPKISKFLKELPGIDAARKELKSFISSLKDYIAPVFMEQPQLMLQPAMAMGDSQQEPEPIEIPIEEPVRLLPMPTGRMLLAETEWVEILSGAIFYCGGIALTTDGRSEVLPVKRGRIPFRLPKETDNYQSIMLAISGSRPALAYLFPEDRSPESPADVLTEIQKHGVLFICYVRYPEGPAGK